MRLAAKNELLLVSGVTVPQTRLYAADDGLVGTGANGATVWDDAGTGGCWKYGQILDPTFGGFGSLTSSGACYAGGTWSVAVAFKSGIPTHVDNTPQPTTQPPLFWPGTGEGTNGEPAGTTRDKVRGALENDPDGYGPVIKRLDCLLGGESVDPTDLCFKLPSCRGESYEICRTRLQGAGFTGAITKRTLGAADAVLEEQADRVTATHPSAATQTEHDTDITVYVNPDELPEMSPAETVIADTLEANNPDTITEKNKKTIARQCVKHATEIGSGRSATDCTLLPVFVTGDDAKGPATNDIAALTRNPTWFTLNHRAPVPRPSPRWYFDRGDPEPGCRNADRPTYDAGGKPECDEFPYWSTLQAKDGSLETLIPSITWVRDTENRRQGTRLGKFYSAGTAGDLPAGCNVYAETPATIAPSQASAFLNVPLPPGTGIDTTWACNVPPRP